MFKVKILFSVLLALISLPCFSFNWQKCKKVLNPRNDFMGFASLVSSSQFTTSTGGCALIGDNIEKKQFIADNIDSLIIDSSKGSGEYLDAFLFLANCNYSKVLQTRKIIQENISIVYGKELSNSPEKSFDEMERLMENNKDLKRFCKFHKVTGRNVENISSKKI